MAFPKVKIILFAFLAVVTIVCHTFVEQYEKVGPEMLTDNWSLHSPESGRAEINKNELYLFSSDHGKDIVIRQSIPSFVQGSILKLSADMKCKDIQPGKKPWNLARLFLGQYDGQMAQRNLPHMVAFFTGTRDWDSYNSIFTIEPGTKKVQVTAQISRSTGSFHLKNIHLYPVSQTQIYTWVKRSILTSWSIFGICLLGSCFFLGKKQILLQAILVLAFIAIIIGTTMPADIKTQVSEQIENQIHTANDTFEQIIPWHISKVGHFAFFVLFGLILSLLMNRDTILLVMLHILLLAAGTEIAQFYIDGRAPLFWDFSIDAAGGLSGIVLIKLSRMKKSKTQN